MPLARYQIRNECGLADPELYKAADKDDPEALLEGVAMAGLVGVLRQLGDLAEFAAEVFHDLHEEVLATAARGHGLMARVQQLEVEFPSIEKSFLAQTHQTPFFTNSGVDWHPNLRMEQNMITRGDLPRFVMDSYEECRGPPRLFLLDKFDVAGAGACLKRYTDPSFFKVEAASYGVPTAEVQREKKNRKVKKKGARWRNGETPEVVSTSHAKLHQLFLEERVENAHSDPARIVKLKRRQLNGFPFDPKPGKSYMERFLGTPSPEHKVVHEVSVNPPLLRLTLDNSCESGLEIIEISAISPSKKSSQGRESNCSSPSSQEVVLKPVTPELNEEAMNREFVKVPDPISGGEADESPCFVHKMANEDELEVDEDRKTEGSLEGDHSDDLMSEVDNYIDALATMESEMETDNECKPKSDIGFLMLGRHGTDSDANEEHLDLQVNFSDSQSYGNSSMSEDGKCSFKKGRSSFSYSNSLSNLAENTPSDNEGVVKVSSSEKSAAKIIDSPMDHLSVLVENQGNDFSDLMCIGEDRTPNARKASCTSCVSDSNTLLLPSVPIVNSIVISSAESAETELDEIPSDYIKHGSKTSNTDQNETALPDSSVVISNVPSQTVHNSLAVSSDDCLVEELDHEDPNVLVCMANMSDLKKEGDDGTVYDVLQTEYTDGIYHKNLVEGKFGTPDSVISPCSVNEEHQTEYADGICDKNLVAGKIGSPHSIISPLKEQLPCSVLPKAAMDSDVALTSDNSDVLKPTQINSEVDDVIAATEHNSENLINMAVTPKLDSIEENQCSDIAVNISQVEHNLKVGMTYSKENIMRLEEISGAADGADLDGCTDKVDKVGEDEHPANYSDKSDLGHLNLDEDVDASPDTVAVTTGAEDHVNDASCPPSDLVCSKSSDLLDIQEFPFGNEDPHLNGLDSNGGVLPEHCTEPKEQEEVKQLEVAPTESKSHLSESISVGNSNVQVLENIDKSAFTYQEENSSYFSDAIAVPSSEWSNQEVESKHASLNHSEDGCEDAACSPTCRLQGVETYFEHSVELQAEQAFAESPSADMHEDSSESLNLQHSPSCRLADSGIPSDHSLELQSDQLDLGCSQVDEACSRSYMQSEQVQSVSDIGQERCLDATSRQEALPSQELLVQSVGHKLSSTVLSRNPFDSVFPSLGPLPENLEEMPPLPPLPPMQWRMGKFQPTSLASQGEWISHGKHTFLPMHPSIADENTVGIEITHRSNPFLSVASGDIQKLEHLYAEYEENSMQPTPLSLGMPTSVRDATNQQGLLPLEATQSLNPFLNLPETINERPEFDFLAPGGNPLKSSSDPLSPVATVEDEPTEHDPVPSHGSQTKPLNQVMPESISEAKVSEQSLQSSEVEQNYLDKSVLPPTRIEDQPQHDLVTMHGETWPPSSLALPPTYEVGKPNGSKLPRPRNPLIDAVAAHDKSKLKKVTERVHPRVGPKADERDSLLQQIRTKSFNLKPTAVTRPSIQGIQGPKTNLKVAAILEKANAIRQALAGSDEDNDTDSWSDS